MKKVFNQQLYAKLLQDNHDKKKFIPKKIFAKLTDNGFIFCLEGHSLIDGSFIEISKEKHTELMQINHGYIGYIDEEGVPQLRHPHTKFDKKTKLWIEDKKAKDDHDKNLIKNALINAAKKLLINSDYMVLPDKYESYTKDKKQQVKDYREALREVIRGNLDKVPTLEGNK